MEEYQIALLTFWVIMNVIDYQLTLIGLELPMVKEINPFIKSEKHLRITKLVITTFWAIATFVPYLWIGTLIGLIFLTKEVINSLRIIYDNQEP